VYENRIMKPIETVLSRGKGMRENDGGNDSNQSTLQAYMEMS
jgi:hypothetical protein